MSEIYLAAAIAFFSLGFIVYLIADVLANHAMAEQIRELRRENKALRRRIKRIESQVNPNAEH